MKNKQCIQKVVILKLQLIIIWIKLLNNLFDLLLSRWQIGLKTKIRGSNFMFDCVNNFKHGGLYIDSLDWVKKKKATINPKNDDDRCFQYAAAIAQNFDKIKKDTLTVSNMKSFINNYNSERIDQPSKIEDWKKFHKIIQQLLLIFCILKEKKCLPLVYQKLIQIVKNKQFS